MSNVSKVKILLETIKNVAIHLTDEEISEIGTVLLKAMDRIENEERRMC